MLNRPPKKRGRRPKNLPLIPASLSENPPDYNADGRTKRKRRGPFSAEYLSPNQAGDEIGLTGEAVKQWIYKRQLPAVKQRNGYWRIKREDFIAFLKERGEPSARLVMLADDDHAFVDKAEKALLDAGYHVQVSVNAADALLKSQDRPPALLVLNLGLDNGSGWSVANQVRELRHTRNIPILFISDKALSQDEFSTILKIGGQAFLRKPVEANHLIHEVRRALGGIIQMN